MAWWDDFVDLARHDLDAIATERLAKLRRSAFPEGAPAGRGTRSVRIALLGSMTLSQLEAGIIVGGLRRGMWVETYTAEYGQYVQEILDPSSGLAAFAPTHLLLALDARTAAAYLARCESSDDAEASFLDHLRLSWKHARSRFPDVAILQQKLLPILPRSVGSNEHRYKASPAGFIDRLNAVLPAFAEAEAVDLIDLSSVTAGRDPAYWYDPLLWFKAKQEITTLASPLYGEIVARVLAAGQGRAAKCLVLDLDNTIWGGVIGDDGLSGIVLGQGSASGEAFLAVQDYARMLSQRGIILAVCSKNDEANALSPFHEHPEMLLKRNDIAAFIANWNDKASNILEIAGMLNIGLDALVFVDDNPFEREQVRRALPMVAVPEVPEDPGLVPFCIADAGYFETIAVTSDDLARRGQYAANVERDRLKSGSSDISAYLASLQMRMEWQPFRSLDHERTTQLINKTNQFNLTTRRYSSAQVLAIAEDPRAIALTFRLRDSFGDNGIIAVVIAHLNDSQEAIIDSWLMSCRVLGRGVEAAMLGVVASAASAIGATALVGHYIPSEKNSMVREHYARLGFAKIGATQDSDVIQVSRVMIADIKPHPHFITVEDCTT